MARLHETIAADHAQHGGEGVIVHLGDYIDRGEDSRGVIERLMAIERAPPAGLTVVCLRGNHEQMLLDAAQDTGKVFRDRWLLNGGRETLWSYAKANGQSGYWLDCIDASHIAWLNGLPTYYHDEARRLFFVHAGIEPALFPQCDAEVHLWTRSARFFAANTWPSRPELAGLTVIHGHTPPDDFEPENAGVRVNVDTGAVFGGPLTCAVLAPGEQVRFLYARP